MKGPRDHYKDWLKMCEKDSSKPVEYFARNIGDLSKVHTILMGCIEVEDSYDFRKLLGSFPDVFQIALAHMEDENGETLLFQAVRKEHWTPVEQALKFPFDLSHTNALGQTVLDIVQDKLIKRLLEDRLRAQETHHGRHL